MRKRHTNTQRVGIALLLLLSGIVNGQDCQFPQQVYKTGDGARHVVDADFNQDGVTDLAVANAGNDTVTVLLGLGDGTFDSKVDYATDSAPRKLAVGDFNSDQVPDLVVACEIGESVSVLLGNGDGTFSPAMNSSVGRHPLGMSIGDFNEDSIADVAVANLNGFSVSILLGNGDGTFAPQLVYDFGANIFDVASADLNGDTHLDLVVPEYSQNQITIMLGNGDGTFSTGETFFASFLHLMYPTSLALEDFDGDNVLDLAVADSMENEIFLFSGHGDGTFMFLDVVDVTLPCANVTAVDFDGDQNLDLLFQGFSRDNVAIVYGNGDLTFGVEQVLTRIEDPTVITAVDLDNNAAMDLIVPSFEHGDVTVVLGFTAGELDTSQPIVPSLGSDPKLVDLNNDSIMDIVGYSYFLNEAYSLIGNGDGTFQDALPYEFTLGQDVQDLNLADFNGDGILDLASVFSADDGTSTASIVLGNGDGTFANESSLLVGGQPRSLAVGDFNGDNIDDLIVADDGPSNESIKVFFGVGNGSFLPSVEYPLPNGARKLDAADLNNDESLDLIVGDGSFNDGSVSIFLNDGNGNFFAGPSYSFDSYFGFEVGDWDRDGTPDFIVNGEGALQVFRGLGDGSFLHFGSFLGAPHVSDMVIGDINGDELIDLAVTEQASDKITVFLNTGTGDFTLSSFRIPGASYLTTKDLDQNSTMDIVVVSNGFIASGLHILLNHDCNSTPQRVVPDSIMVTHGNQFSGGALQLGTSDDADLSIRRSPQDILARTEFEVSGISSVGKPGSIEIVFEGSVFSRTPIQQTIEMFNHTDTSWEQVDLRPASRFSDATVILPISGDVSRFVDPVTREIKARVNFQSPTARTSFASNTDQFVWIVGQ